MESDFNKGHLAKNIVGIELKKKKKHYYAILTKKHIFREKHDIFML